MSQIKITFSDGNIKEFDKNMSADIIKSISISLSKAAHLMAEAVKELFLETQVTNWLCNLKCQK